MKIWDGPVKKKNHLFWDVLAQIEPHVKVSSCDEPVAHPLLQYGDDDYENMGDEEYDDYSKELSQYKKSKDRGRGLWVLFIWVNQTFNDLWS